MGLWRPKAGATGLRARGLLDSAFARPRQHYASVHTSDVVQMAALYTAGIIRNHPFVDGNKRTGFVIGVLFIELHGFDFKASEADATQAIMALAAGTFDDGAYTAWLRENVKHQATAGSNARGP